MQKPDSYQVFIVEDESIVAADIEESLIELGYKVTGKARSGETALKQLQEVTADVVLMDISLAGEMDGIDTAQQVSSKLNIPVIFLTAHADPETLQRAKITEPYGYVLKPFNEMELHAAIQLAVYKHRQNTSGRTSSVGGKSLDEFLARHSAPSRDNSAEVQEICDFLKTVDPFHEMSADLINAIARLCKLEDVSEGTVIAFEGDEKPTGLIVAEGRIALIKASPNGKELIVDLLPPGDSFGLLTAAEKGTYTVSLRAQVDSKILWAPREVVLGILEHVPEISRRFFDKTFARLRKAHDFSRALAHDLVETRVAAALTSMRPVFSRSNSTVDTVSIDIKRQELADLTGSTPETVIRVTKAMERDGILDLSKPTVITIVDNDRLEEMAEPL